MSIDIWIDKDDVVHIHYRKLLNNNAIWNNMDGPRDYHTKWRERQIYHITYICNLNYDTKVFTKQKQTPSSVQFSSVTQSCLTLCDPMDSSTPGLLVHCQLPEFTQIHAHRISGAIQPSHPLSSPSPPAPNPSQHQSLFQWVNSSHQVAIVLEFQLYHQSFQRTPRTDLL